MNEIVKTVKISSKGQITLPKAMRDTLGTDIVTVTAKDGSLVIDPLPNLAGALKKYAKNPPIPFAEEREKAWLMEMEAKYGRRRPRR